MIFHITDTEKWENALKTGIYKHPSLHEEGFIHCSTAAQLSATLGKHFANATEVIILTIVEKRISPILKWDTLDTGEKFPHIYANIPLYAVERATVWMKNVAGVWEEVG